MEHAMIIGGMKCGTSSFYHYLIQHPQICPAKMKEPMFFTEYQLQKVRINNYLDLWDFEPQKHRILLEASTGYTKYPFEPNVAKKIHEYGINPKMIYCIRNPYDRIISQYEYSRGRNWPNQDELSDLIPLSNYYLQLKQYEQFFSKSQILLMDFDLITRDPQQAVNQVFDYLQLPPQSVDHSKIYNKTGVTNETGEIICFPDKVKPKRTFTPSEKELVYQALKPGMVRLKEEYHFDVSKWGF